MSIVFFIFFFDLPTTLVIVDGETGEPIEGAVGLAMWEGTRGLPGFSTRYTAKALEAESTAEGRLTMPFRFGRAAIFEPHLKIYKSGYVGWDSEYIYKGGTKNNELYPIVEKRSDFSLRNQVIHLEPWKKSYSYRSHFHFIQTFSSLYEAGLRSSQYERAILAEARSAYQEIDASKNRE